MQTGAEFQSLLHQGISLLIEMVKMTNKRQIEVSIPSSSGHQFTVLHHAQVSVPKDHVSIPSSSGHQFTAKEDAETQIWSEYVSIPSSSGHQFTGRGAMIWNAN